MRAGVLAATLLVAMTSVALSAAAQSAETGPTPSPTRPHVASGTPVLIEITELVSSKTHNRGDKFAIRLAAPIQVDDRTLVPAGVTGVGQVIDSARSGMLGKPAKLLLAARYLDFDGAQIPLRTLQLGKVGADATNAIMVASFVPYVGIAALLVHGGEIEVPAGTRAQAKLAADFPAEPVPAPSGPATSNPLEKGSQ